MDQIHGIDTFVENNSRRTHIVAQEIHKLLEGHSLLTRTAISVYLTAQVLAYVEDVEARKRLAIDLSEQALEIARTGEIHV